MAMKTLINRTGYPLKVTLIVREGDHPDHTAGTVEVELAARAVPAEDMRPAGGTGDQEDREAASVQQVTYGNDINIYLNAVNATMVRNETGIKRDFSAGRGSPMDYQLNTNDTIEFLFDGEAILISATNSDDLLYSFPAA